MRAADFGPSLSMFKKMDDIEFSYKIMYVCMYSGWNNFCDILLDSLGPEQI